MNIDDRPVWGIRTRFYPVTAQKVYFGSNAINGSTCDRYFHGAIFSIDRLAPPAEYTAGPGAGSHQMIPVISPKPHRRPAGATRVTPKQSI